MTGIANLLAGAAFAVAFWRDWAERMGEAMTAHCALDCGQINLPAAELS